MSQPSDSERVRIFRSISSAERKVTQKKAKDYVTTDDLEKICKYLRNPISTGLWLFKGKWHKDRGIANEINKELKNLEKSDTKIKDKNRSRRASYLLNKAGTMSFALNLFNYMVHSERAEEKTSKPAPFEIDTDFEPIIQVLNLRKLIRKYERQLDCFKNRIFFKGYSPTLGFGEFGYTKSGLIFVKNENAEDVDKAERNFTFMALESEPLEGLAEFFSGLGKISDFTIAPLYSPEEEVFEPYFSILGLVYDRLFGKAKIHTIMEQSISIFQGGNYPYCISTIGLILEEQLIQIYETLFRCRCPPRSTLGELLDLIEKQVKNTVVHERHKKAIDATNIYEEINSSLEGKTSNPVTTEEMLKLIRDILTFVRESDKQILSKTTSPMEKESISIFPNDLRDGMDELIMYRNAISHKSRIPIGSFEALKSIYHISSLIMWWTKR